MAEKKQVLRIDIKGNEELIRLRKDLQLYQKQLKDLRDKHRNVGEITEDVATQFANLELNVKKTRSEFNKASKSLTSVNTTTKKGIGFVGKMAGAFAAANIATAAFTAAARALGQAIKQGIITFKDFEFQMAKVKAISGASDKEFKKLQDSAQELGRTTFFTASQVGELQLNLSKLGFRPEEILQSQEAILQLSTAMGEDLGRTATVVAATLRGFGESTEETARFADGMAAAFSNSALDIEKFQTSMSKVSAIAAMAGFSFEETTGLLALLTNSGMEASIAGTSLRNILLHLQDPTSDLSEKLGRTVHSGEDLIIALKELSDSGIDVAGVMEIVDRRQVQAMNSFIAGADTLTEFNKILNSSSGAAEDMADIMEDTLGGALLKLKSAYEGLTLALLEGSGVMQSAVEFLATTLNSLADSFTSADTRAERFVTTTIKDLKKEFKELSKSEEDFEGTLSGMMAHRRGRMEQRLEDTKEDLRLFLEENSTFAIARDKDLIAQKKAYEREIETKELAVAKMAEAISTQIAKEKEASDKFEENEKKRLAALRAEAEANSSLIKIQEDKLEQAKKLPETTEAEITSKNILIKSIETEIKRLKELGVEKKKQERETQVKIQGDNVSATEAVINQQKADLQKAFLESKVMTEKDYNDQLHKIQVDALTTALEFETLTTEERIKLQDKLFKIKQRNANADSDATKQRIQQLTETGKILMEVGQAQGENNALTQAGIKITQLASIASGIDGLINAEVGIAEQAKLPFPANIIAMAATAASLVSVIANIKALLGGSGGGGGASVSGGGDAITFANGGLLQGGMFKGASHANGGVKFAVGGRIMEAEGGEAIINKRSTAAFRPILSAINSYNGNGVKFAEGGLLSTGEKFAMGGELRSIQNIISGGATQRVVLVESDVTSTQNRVSALESRASF